MELKHQFEAFNGWEVNIQNDKVTMPPLKGSNPGTSSFRGFYHNPLQVYGEYEDKLFAVRAEGWSSLPRSKSASVEFAETSGNQVVSICLFRYPKDDFDPEWWKENGQAYMASLRGSSYFEVGLKPVSGRGGARKYDTRETHGLKFQYRFRNTPQGIYSVTIEPNF